MRSGDAGVDAKALNLSNSVNPAALNLAFLPERYLSVSALLSGLDRGKKSHNLQV